MKKFFVFSIGAGIGVAGKCLYDKLKGSKKLVESFDSLTARLEQKVEMIQSKILEKCESKSNSEEKEEGEK